MRVQAILILAAWLAMPGKAQNSTGRPEDGSRQKGSPVSNVLDANGDGTLEAQEIANANKMLLKLDANKDGALSAEELQPASSEKAGSDDKKRPRMLVSALDLNGDGKLEATEIAQASGSLLKLDTNGDGKLSKKELRRRKRSESDDRVSNAQRDGSGDHVAKPGENKPY